MEFGSDESHYSHNIFDTMSADYYHPPARDRSSSRPPAIGPARTTRQRRGNSVSSMNGTSPPPATYHRPHPILIPNTRPGTTWTPSSSEYSLPTPADYTPFSLDHMHLPPLPQKDFVYQSLPSGTGAGTLSPSTAVPPLGISYGHQYGHHISSPTSSSLPTSSPLSPQHPQPQPQQPPALTFAHDKQSLLANEKRRRRRESHNAVERRRRDNINERISELATLIPECMLDGTVSATNASGDSPPPPSATSPTATGEPLLPTPVKEEGVDASSTPAEAGIVKANKGMILRKSVEYIRYLQQLVTAQGARNRELESELKAYRGDKDLSSVSSSDGTTRSTPGGDHDHDDVLDGDVVDEGRGTPGHQVVGMMDMVLIDQEKDSAEYAWHTTNTHPHGPHGMMDWQAPPQNQYYAAHHLPSLGEEDAMGDDDKDLSERARGRSLRRGLKEEEV